MYMYIVYMFGVYVWLHCILCSLVVSLNPHMNVYSYSIGVSLNPHMNVYSYSIEVSLSYPHMNVYSYSIGGESKLPPHECV